MNQLDPWSGNVCVCIKSQCKTTCLNWKKKKDYLIRWPRKIWCFDQILLPPVDTCPVHGRIRCLMGPCLENPMDRGAWSAAVHGVSKSRTRLSDFTFTFHFHALEKIMATHSIVLAWRIPRTGEPDGLPSIGSYRVGHDWSDLAGAAAAAAWTLNEY